MLLQELTPIFQKIFSDESLEIKREMTTEDIEKWDSLTHMELIATIEKKYSIKFSFKEIMAFENIGDMVDCLEGKV